jgi:hypothetical protein
MLPPHEKRVRAPDVDRRRHDPQTTRALAEEQFMKRALIEKIQTGLAVSS